MEIVGNIMDPDDIVLSTRVRNGVEAQVGSFKFMTTKPTAVIEVGLSEEQVKGNMHVELKGLVGKRITLQLQYVENSYQGKQGEYKSFNGFRLFSLPVKGA